RLLVADELASETRYARKVRGALNVGLLAARTRHLAVLLHQLAEAVDVDRLAPLLGELDGELDREAERRRERERFVARDRVLARELLELPGSPRERLAEPLLLEADDTLDLLRVLPQLRVRVAHLLDDHAAEPVHVVEADALAVLHRAADDPPADVAAALVG